MDERLLREADAVGQMTERLRGRIPPALAVFAFVLQTPVPRRTVNPSVSNLC